MTANSTFTRSVPRPPGRALARTFLATLLLAGPAVVPAQQAAPSPRSRTVLSGGSDLAGLGGLASLSGLAALGSLRSLASLGDVDGVRSLSSLAALPRAAAALQLEAAGMAMGLSGLQALAELPEGLDVAGRPAWPLDQVGDSLYRQARERMNRGEYKRAAELFMEVARRAGKQPLAGDALYWNAYSLYRDGGTSALADALASLDRLGKEFPAAATAGDANALRMRVCGELARRGDEQCAAQVAAGAAGRAGVVAVEEARASARTSASASARARAEARVRGRSSTSEEPGCPREDDDERIAALNALLQMDADRALPILEKVLARRDRCSTALRRKAVFLVSQKGDARAADILMGAVRNDPDSEVREQAVFWLGQTRDERAVEMLEEILKKETNDEVLDKAVFALSQHRSERAGTILRDLAQRDGAPLKVREQAIFWLGQQRNTNNAELLKNLYVKVNAEELKEKIIFSISQNRGANNGPWLLDIALNEKEPIEMRKKALFWAGQSRGLSMDDLGNLYNRIGDREMKEQIIFVYSQRRDPAATDKLMQIAKTEKDPELRKKAIFWLTQSRDPRVAKFLEEIIG